MKPITVPDKCAEFDELFVVSDLHLGGEPGLQLFAAGEEFDCWVTEIVLPALRPKRGRRPRRVAIVINGDFVDFLADPEARSANAPFFNPDLARRMLPRLVADPNSASVFSALRKFVQEPGASLIITLGNHDLELAVPGVQRQLLDLIALNDHDARGRIHLRMEDNGFICRVGSDAVWCVHGNSDDPWNRVDRRELESAVAASSAEAGKSGWKPNPGTQLVMQMLNHVKADYRFAELLKPENQAVPPLLLMLAPEHRLRIESALGAVAFKIRNSLKSWFTSLLGAEECLQMSGRPAAEQPALELLCAMLCRPHDSFRFDADSDAAELLFRAHSSTVAKLQHPQRGRLAGGQPRPFSRQGQGSSSSAGSGTNEERLLGWWKAFVRASGSGTETEVIQAFLEELQQYRGFDETSPCDTQYRAFAEDFGDVALSQPGNSDPVIRFPSVVITGHTHQARASLPLGRYAEAMYFNSGTWAQVMRIPPEVISDPRELEALVKKLRQPGNAELMNDGHLVWSPKTYVRVQTGAQGKAVAELKAFGEPGIMP